MAERLEAIVSRYSKEHYEDVAKVLKENRAWARQMDSTHGRAVMASTIGQFAELFAADNPPVCQVGGHDGPCTPACLIGGFNREQFLTACGLATEPAIPDSIGEDDPACGHSPHEPVIGCCE
ncbi:hypothetical protein LCGC14_2390360 [marine sediment metagenome]|uniref:Uncharacterized protein n=1 Tax=marine sediment metagenome TaxID=412755 RepID=A0A0F9EAM8_9ZZZZ